MAAPANSGESGMATEDFCSTLSPLLSPRWSQLCLTPSPPRSFLPSSSSMVMQDQGSNQSIDDPPQNQEHDHIVNPAPYLAGDSALLQQQQQLSPTWSQLCLTPSPPRSFLPSSSSMVMQYQGSNQSIDDLPQNQEHDHIVDPAPYLAGDSALLQQQQQLRQNWSEVSDWRPRGGIMTMNVLELQSNNQGFEESNMGFYFPPSSPTYFPLYRPMSSVFFVSSNIQDISLALSYQHILEDKSGALHVLNQEEHKEISPLLFDNFLDYVGNMPDDLGRIAMEEGVWPDDVLSLADGILDAGNDMLDAGDLNEGEVTLRRMINWLEQKDEDEDNVDPLVFELGCVAQQLIQNRGGELDMILGGGVYTVNGLELGNCQDPPTTPETLLICQAKLSFKLWLGHGGQWAAELRGRYNSLNNGSFTTVEDAMSAYELVIRWSGRADLTGFPGLFENENRSKLPLRLPPPAQELNLVEDFGLVCCNAMGDDEIEAVGTGSQGTEECVMAHQTRLNSGCLGKRKPMKKNPGGERRNKKTNGARTTISLEDILQTKGMHLKDAANHLKVSITKLKSSCREYGILRWPPRNECKLTRQSLFNETCHIVDQEEIPQLTSHSNQVLMATVDKNIVHEKEIPPPQLLPIAQQENIDASFGNDEVEAIGIGIEGTREDVIEKTQLNSGCLGKGKWKEKSPRGDRGHNKTTGVRISIPKEDILETKGMRLADAAKHLEVSRSTFKRACREYGIERWPPRKERELISQSHPNESPTVVDQERIPQSNSDMLLPSAQVSATIGTNNVTIMARYGEVRIKFRLSWPWRMVELEQQVKKRLPLKPGTYYIKYKDEDDGLMTLIACDEDLEDYISSSSRLGTPPIEVFLEPKLASS